MQYKRKRRGIKEADEEKRREGEEERRDETRLLQINQPQTSHAWSGMAHAIEL